MDFGAKADEVMTEAQRAQYLIRYCCGGSAVDFAKSIGTNKTRVSKIVHGKLRLDRLYDTILSVYPDVNPVWLRTGKGNPGNLTIAQVRAYYEEIIAEKDALIKTLQKIIDEKL